MMINMKKNYGALVGSVDVEVIDKINRRMLVILIVS